MSGLIHQIKADHNGSEIVNSAIRAMIPSLTLKMCWKLYQTLFSCVFFSFWSNNLALGKKRQLVLYEVGNVTTSNSLANSDNKVDKLVSADVDR